MMFEIPPVTPVVGKAIPPLGSGDEPVRSSNPAGVGQRLDILV